MAQNVENKQKREWSKDGESCACLSRNNEISVPEGARLLNLRQAAVYTGLSYWTLRDYIADGILPRVNLPSGGQRAKSGVITRKAGDANNRKILIDREDLDRLISQNKVRMG